MLRAALLSTALLLSPVFAQTAPNKPADSTTPRNVGGSVLPPKLIHQVEPNYPRSFFGKIKNSDVLVGLTVTAEGLPANLHIVRSGGSAFDKSAMQCVALYRFSPALENGDPVPVYVNVDVNFQVVARNTRPRGAPTP